MLKGSLAHIVLHAGPSLPDLLFALAQGSTTTQTPVAFHGLDKSFQVRIIGLSREDGSGHNWLFSGYLPDDDQPALAPAAGAGVHGYFNTSRRTGWLAGT